MSYMLYINGQLVELSPSKPVAQTKQVNDIAKLDNRQTNYTNKFIAPLTANNVRIMEGVYLTGNQSDLPYTQVIADLYDGDSGECLIYKGWANISNTNDKGYEIHIYDGIIDFYRAIENQALTDIDITPLNHLKNLDTVIHSFTAYLPYKYIIGDYNGKNQDILPGDIHLGINIDYQVPSARNEWIWNRIFEYIGWTFSGSTFETDAFKDFYMTFPKPVPQSVPVTTSVSQQDAQIFVNTVPQYGPDGMSFEYVHYYYALLFPNSFTNSFATHVGTDAYITINATGSYMIKTMGSFCGNGGACSGAVTWSVRNAANVLVSSGTYDNAVDPPLIITVNATDRFFIFPVITGFLSSTVNWPMTGSMQTFFEHVDGFDANFTEALVDFKITDYVNEIMQRFCLTGFKDKRANHIEFLTIEEIISNEPEDWSKFSPKKTSEKYVYGNYAKVNRFKYRYNDENSKHHDSYIQVVNENLKDEITVINSKIYAPDLGQVAAYGPFTGVFRMWNKELKDDGVIVYKDLAGRYYFLRSVDYTFTIIIGSKALNTYQEIDVFPVVNYDRMPFVDVIEDNYSFMQTLLNKAKTLDVGFKLTSNKVATFDFKRSIFVEQLGSYYLVNKIKGFTKDKLTICEIIEVDKDQTSIISVPPIYTLELLSYSVTTCVITIPVNTNIDQPAYVTVAFDIPPLVPGGTGASYTVTGTLDGDIITCPLANVPYTPIAYSVSVIYISPIFVQTLSNTISVLVPDGCFVSSGFLTELSYTRNPGEDMIITIDTDIPFPFNISLSGSRVYPTFELFFPITVVATSTVIHFPGVPAGAWEYVLQSGSITSNHF